MAIDMGWISGLVLGPYSNERSILSPSFNLLISLNTICDSGLGRIGRLTHSGFKSGISTDNPTMRKIILLSNEPSKIKIFFKLNVLH